MGTFADLQALYTAAEPFELDGDRPPSIIAAEPSTNGHAAPGAPLPLANEADNDPHRLARCYLERHSHTLRYWRQEWWRYDGRRYVRFSVSELAAEVTAACKAEFDRINLAAIENPEAISADGKLPEALKVARGLVSNVIGALEGACIVADAIEQTTWIGEPRAASSHCLSLSNGILDLDALLAGEDDPAKILLPHSPAWFSPISLSYSFDPDAECPRWDAFMARNLEGDNERIDVLQEWAGYLLLPNAEQQKFLFLEGEGSNGKSVYHAAIEAMLGDANVSHVPLESFAERFALYGTIGKLANIAADCGELDKAAEGILKSFTSGDRMTFDRKGLSLVDATPTARLSIAANNRPQFKDRSSGLWRRMIVVPFLVQIEEEEKIKGMDKPTWWEWSGELPGILNWAIAGLHRLRLQRRFTESKIGASALEEYRNESNSARAFLKSCCRECEAQVDRHELYDAYKKWCKENGYHPVHETNFGKEVKRVFPKSEKRRIGSDGNRHHAYFGIFS